MATEPTIISRIRKKPSSARLNSSWHCFAAFWSRKDARAYAIKQNAKLRFASYADYFKAVDALELEQQAIAYETDGGATVRWKKENA